MNTFNSMTTGTNQVTTTNTRTQKPICRHHAIGKHCMYGEKCKFSHDAAHLRAKHLRQPIQADQRQPLIHTQPGSLHFLNFWCIVCRTLIVSCENIRRIHKNRVWTDQPRGVYHDLSDIHENPYKMCKQVSVRCRGCHNPLGNYFEGIGYKMVYIMDTSGQNWMYITTPLPFSLSRAVQSLRPLMKNEKGEGYENINDIRPYPRRCRERPKRLERAMVSAMTDVSTPEQLVRNMTSAFAKMLECSDTQRKVYRALHNFKQDAAISEENKCEALLCCICEENPRNIMLKPCNHLLMCDACHDVWRERFHLCPGCNGMVDGHDIVYT